MYHLNNNDDDKTVFCIFFVPEAISFTHENNTFSCGPIPHFKIKS